MILFILGACFLIIFVVFYMFMGSSRPSGGSKRNGTENPLLMERKYADNVELLSKLSKKGGESPYRYIPANPLQSLYLFNGKY